MAVALLLAYACRTTDVETRNHLLSTLETLDASHDHWPPSRPVNRCTVYISNFLSVQCPYYIIRHDRTFPSACTPTLHISSKPYLFFHINTTPQLSNSFFFLNKTAPP